MTLPAPEPLPGDPPDGDEGPYLRSPSLDADAFAPFAFLRDALGFVPSLFRAQTLRLDVLEAEASVVRAILLTSGVLPRAQKELVVLAVSAANLNSCLVAQGIEILRTLGIPEETCLAVVRNEEGACLPEASRGLLDFARKLGMRPAEVGAADVDGLRRLGFSEPQILEAIVAAALAQFFHVVQAGLGAPPDFPTGHLSLNPLPAPVRPTPEGGLVEAARVSAAAPDTKLVERARLGDLDAFEELVKQNEQRVLRTLRGITSSLEDAEDCAQRVFLKAYQRLAAFREASSFSTWVTRIAINEGIERVRSRRSTDSLEDFDAEGEEPFRPRQLQAWTDDPEAMCARSELQGLIEREISKLPYRYRVAVMLRDIEQMTAAEAAAALGLPVPTLKTHLLRGRMMLREALAPLLYGPQRQSHA